MLESWSAGRTGWGRRSHLRVLWSGVSILRDGRPLRDAGRRRGIGLARTDEADRLYECGRRERAVEHHLEAAVLLKHIERVRRRTAESWRI